MVSQSHQHVCGPLKQKNKKHKTGGHKSKHQVGKKDAKNACVGRKLLVVSKKTRVNDNKRKLVERGRALKDFQKQTGFYRAHIPIAVISLSNFTIEEIVKTYRCDSNYTVAETHDEFDCKDYFSIESKLHKQRLLLLNMSQDTAFYYHDTISASQAIWILLDDQNNDIDDLVTLFQTFESIHLPPIFHIIKFSNSNKKYVQNFLDTYSENFGALKCDSDNIIKIIDGQLNIHKLSKCIPKNHFVPNYVSRINEDSRKDINIICERMSYIKNENNGSLIVEGTLRGGELSVNDSITIPGFGNFLLKSIETSTGSEERNDSAFVSPNFNVMDIEEDTHIQTDYIDKDMDTENDNFKNLMNINHEFHELPKMDIEMTNNDENEDSSDSKEESDFETDDEEFDDETDFKIETSKIDEKEDYFISLEECLRFGQLLENPNNKRIIEFQNYRLVMKEIAKNTDQKSIKAGTYVKLTISDFSHIFYEFFKNFFGRLIVHKLYPYENQLSIVNYFIHKKDNTPDIYSNNKYFFFCGPRRFKATAVFSCLSNCKKTCHKVINTVEGEAYIVVTMIAFITFPHAPVVMFSQSDDGELNYIGSGHVLPFSKRILVNELILEGSVRKAYKKSTVVTGLFKNRDEAERYKFIEVYTQMGDKGHIVKPIGTHGVVKCHFTLPTLRSQKIIGKLYKPQPMKCDIETEVYIPPNTSIDEIKSDF